MEDQDERHILNHIGFLHHCIELIRYFPDSEAAKEAMRIIDDVHAREMDGNNPA